MRHRLLGVTAALALLAPACRSHPDGVQELAIHRALRGRTNGSPHRKIRNAAEALAHAVEAGRWGCTDATTRAASRSAFETLHRIFPASESARRTKYWY